MNSVYREKGFSLIELVTIIILLGIVSFVVVPKLNTSTSTLRAARDDVVAGLFYAQQLAMARADESNAITFVATSANVFTVQLNGTDMVVGSGYYPLALPNGVQFSGGGFPITLTYSRLGETTATNFTLTRGSASATVQVSATGFAK